VVVTSLLKGGRIVDTITVPGIQSPTRFTDRPEMMKYGSIVLHCTAQMHYIAQLRCTGQLPANVVLARAFGGCFKISAKTELLSIATASASSAVSSVTKNCSALLSCER
jgi:hypothetical protein